MRAAVIALLLAAACGEHDEESDPPSSPPPPAEGCQPGEAAREDGSCEPAGIPDGACDGSMVSDGARGIVAVLPAARCPAGQMAVPGETACRPVAPCGSARWPDVSGGGSVFYVDAAYTGGNNDGSQARPFTTIDEAVTTATSGATIAIAAGTYPSDLVLQNESLRLWGVCPESVIIEGTGVELGAVVLANAGASASELRDLSVTGPRVGVVVFGAANVVLERVWIHDTGSRGFNLQDDLGPTSATLRGSLIEATTQHGIFAAGAPLTIEHSVVRDVAVMSGYGLGVEIDDSVAVRGSLQMAGSLVEGHGSLGVVIYGSDATIEASVVRDANASFAGDGAGRGIGAQIDPANGQRANVSVTCSVLERNRDVGLFVDASDMRVRHVVVRDTLPQALDQRFGRAMLFQGDAAGARSLGEVVESLVERSHDTGISAIGSDLTASSVVVRDIRPQASDMASGLGLGIEESDLVAGQRSNGTVRSSVIQGAHEVGLFVYGSDALIEDTAVVDTQPSAQSGRFGRGISIQDQPVSGGRSVVTVRRALVERSSDSGISIINSDGVLEGVVVASTLLQSALQLGDGVSVTALGQPASAMVTGARITNNARAGIASFGASVSLGDGIVACNAIDLNGEAFMGFEAAFMNLGGNACGCGETMGECQLHGSTLAPPEPVADQ